MKNLPPVVLIHGMWSMPETLNDLKAEFESEGYTVHVPCLPHHCPRNQFDEQRRQALARASIEEYVTALSKYVSELKVPPILVGHSMGGLLAQLLASRHTCEKLILISSAAPAGINAWRWSVMRTFGHNLFKVPLWRSTTNLLLKNIVYGIANTQSAAVQKDIIRHATYESGWASMQISMWFLFRRPPTRVDYDSITCPILIIGGTEDKITPISIQKKIAEKYGHKATLNVIDGACHWTIGGSFMPTIRQSLFSWLGHSPLSKAP